MVQDVPQTASTYFRKAAKLATSTAAISIERNLFRECSCRCARHEVSWEGGGTAPLILSARTATCNSVQCDWALVSSYVVHGYTGFDVFTTLMLIILFFWDVMLFSGI
jgi:hypothetical protein